MACRRRTIGCSTRTQNCHAPPCHPAQGKWSAEDDERLRQLVAEKGSTWKEIAPALGRMPLACRDRWKEVRAPAPANVAFGLLRGLAMRSASAGGSGRWKEAWRHPAHVRERLRRKAQLIQAGSQLIQASRCASRRERRQRVSVHVLFVP